ncbi:glycosyltransferase family 2 protein [Azospirillum sp. sgz302134]
MKEPITKADITAAILLDDDTLVLFGAIDRPLPAMAGVHLDGETEGRFAGRCWTDAEGERWFLGGIRVPGLAQMRPTRVEITEESGDRLVLPRLSNVRTNPAHLIAALKGFQPGALALALDFAVALAASSEGPSDRIGRLLSGLAQEVSQPDGFAELFGRFRDGSLMLQGWARSVKTGPQKLLIEADDLGAYRATAASFARPDLPSDAAGVLAVLTDATPAPGTIRRIHYRAADGWRHMEMFEHRTILPDGVASAHIRDMLGNLQDAEARQQVGRIAASRYDGAETVSKLDIPVRTGLDMALRVPGAGLFVAGWLLDPTRQVRAVTLKGPGVSARLDAEWSRLARRDVTEAFQHDGLFAGRLVPGQDQHGFTAFAAEPAGLPGGLSASLSNGAEFHLELELADDRFAFMPLSCLPPAPEALNRMLALVNLDSPSIDQLIARHVGPMLRAARSRVAEIPATGIHPMGRPVRTPRVSVVMPVTDGRADVDLNIARLAIDPDFAEAELLVVAAAGTHERLGGAVRQAAAFYRLSVTFVAAPEATDAFEAIAAALPHARAERVLMLSPSVLPTGKGWLSALERVSRKSGGPVMVSPTLLYEDHSIRFAGIMAVEGADGTRCFERRFAGYPQDWLKEQDAATVDAAAPECALLPKDALARALASMGAYLGADHKGLDLCLRLRALGGACVWLPRVTLVALDEQPRDAHADRWRRAGALVDRWSFEESWSARVAA